jgi:SAM-dependent methyltransferase
MWAILTASDKRGGGWSAEEFFATGVAEVAYLMDRTTRWGCPRGRRQALDFGCGVGRITQPLGDYFEKVYGVDISLGMLDLARRHNRKGDRCEYEWSGGDLRRFANASFDLIYSRLTLQHIRPREVRSYLKEFLRLLAPGGLLYFQYPSCALRAQLEFRLARISWRLLQTQSPMYINGMNRDRVVALLERNGGTIVEIENDPAAGAKYASYAYAVTA